MNRYLTKKLLAISTLSGVAALGYEVIWHRALANLLGSEARATTLILSVFIGGLAIGYRVFGQKCHGKSARELITWTAKLELYIGLWSFFLLGLQTLILSNLSLLPAGGWLGVTTDALIAFLLIAPPTFFMGGTLPMLSQAAASTGAPTRMHALVYSFNTLGAFFGCLATGFFILPALGIAGSSVFSALINFGAALWLYKIRDSFAGSTNTNTSRIDKSTISIQEYLVAGLVGFISLGLQTILIRVAALTFGGSEYAFTIIVSVYVVMIAAGSWFIIGRGRILMSLSTHLFLLLSTVSLLYLSIPEWPYWHHLIQSIFDTHLSFTGSQVTAFLMTLSVCGIPVGLLGATMPLLIKVRSSTEEEIGADVGSLYFANSIGAVFGAFGLGYLALQFVNLEQIFQLIILLAFFALCLSPNHSATSKRFIIGGFALTIICLTVPSWDNKKLTLGVFRLQETTSNSFKGSTNFFRNEFSSATLLDHRDDPNGTVTVVEFKLKDGTSRAILVNGKSDGDTVGDQVSMNLLGHIPALFRNSSSNKVAVVGYGTGMTISALLNYDLEIDIIEISEAVKKFAHYFENASPGVLDSSAVSWITDDAYRVFSRGNKEYGLIISQPSDPWTTGMDKLYTSDFYHKVQSSLATRGLFLQWFGLHNLSTSSAKLIVSTFVKSFPHRKFFQIGNNLMMLGANDEIGAEAIEAALQRYAKPKIRNTLAGLYISSFEELLAKETWLPVNNLKRGRANSLLNPILAFRAGKDFHKGVSSTVNLLSETHREHAEVLNYSFDSLLATWISMKKDLDPGQFLKASCGSGKVNLVEPRWRIARSPCREAIIYYLSRPGSKVPAYLFQEFKWLREFQSNETIEEPESSKNLEVILQDIKNFGQFHSILIPLSSKKLLRRVAHCYDGKNEKNFDCRLRLLQVLSFTGHTQEAKAELSRLKQEYDNSIEMASLVKIEKSLGL